ncbi:G-type lectin S-receptor-like serine/threonine-protein kinase At1g11330 [Benincasa hispida]|uniref:G-type lectin S-receptor-like serine/threonine-protein kinase At1g11330 n=1 Tax=Benincasa hispida TaxID=102211 RepID=UPI00190060D9|nr:G-type lectin S-receptor-like serine/threonine-protein kinase At1g11330 [Benincasa hispida]
MTKPQMNWNFSDRLLFLLSLITCFSSKCCFGSDTITSTEYIKYPATIISNATSFELGWFSPLNSTTQYIGIWYHQVSLKTLVWVANKDTPLNNTSGIFTISNDGNVVILDENNTTIWSSNVTSPTANTTARILDSGNLVLEDPASGFVIWESFKHPSNLFLPSMKLITNKKTQEKLQFTSWKTPSDPSKGNFSLSLDVLNIPEAVIRNYGGNPYWRSGPWNGHTFIGIPEMISVYLVGFNLAIEDQAYYFSISYSNEDQLLYNMVLSPEGNLEQQYWDPSKENWEVSWSAFRTECDYYGVCGVFGVCNANVSPVCSCLTGFKPKDEDEWNRGNWSNGCVRNTPLQCENSSRNNTRVEEDGFLKVELVKVPFLAEWSNSSTSADDCKQECFQNCSCSAYAYENGIGCMIWRRDLFDVQKFESLGANLHLRLAYADLQTINDVRRKSTGIIIAIVIPATLMIFIIAIYFWWRWKAGKNEYSKKGKRLKLRRDDMIGDKSKFEELPLYDYENLAIATHNFDLSNKLGQGGFGPVYKGRLLDGQEIAIKRLSRASNQGYEEFINEVIVISKLQHRNLVQLLGCCIEGEEKMLIYEYLPNLSLDAFIFDSIKQKTLDWRKRFNIIDGIARGLLYLHRDSRLRIIHRDLKASNILLDKDMNPKISDFGMARIFYSNEVQANTNRLVGTYGYMSPEYAMQGQISEKSDVFSFGVLLLEIISGRRNTGFNHHEHALSLLEFAWKLWIEDNLIALIDPTIYESSYYSEILRCIQVGLLCVEESINDRPNALTIVSMLNSEIVDLPLPNQCSFIGRPTQSNGEDPHRHLKKFYVVCNGMRPNGVTQEQINMRAFPFSLKGDAKE